MHGHACINTYTLPSCAAHACSTAHAHACSKAHARLSAQAGLQRASACLLGAHLPQHHARCEARPTGCSLSWACLHARMQMVPSQHCSHSNAQAGSEVRGAQRPSVNNRMPSCRHAYIRAQDTSTHTGPLRAVTLVGPCGGIQGRPTATAGCLALNSGGRAAQAEGETRPALLSYGPLGHPSGHPFETGQ